MTDVDPRNPVPDPRSDLGPFSGPGAAARPWADSVDALRRTQKFTLCTVRADGRPHATPLLAIWAGDGMFFCSGANEQKATNLAQNPHGILRAGTDTLTGFDYVVEGVVSLVQDAEVRGAVADAFELAYGWHLTGPDGTWRGMGDMMRSGEVNTYALRPSIAFAFGNGEPFSETRYRFD